MVIRTVENLVKKDIPLHYRNEYEALGVIDVTDFRLRVPFSFSVEINASGEREIELQVLETIDYPLVPIVQGLKERIRAMEKDGKLP